MISVLDIINKSILIDPIVALLILIKEQSREKLEKKLNGRKVLLDLVNIEKIAILIGIKRALI